jgi:hypothetical protein
VVGLEGLSQKLAAPSDASVACVVSEVRKVRLQNSIGKISYSERRVIVVSQMFSYL